MTSTRFIALSLATVLTPGSTTGTLPTMSHIAGIAMLIAERDDDCNWRFTLESHAVAAGTGEDALLVWAIGAMPDHGTVLGWKLADDILPPLLDAATDGDREIGRAFLERLTKLVTGLSVDLAIPHGGAGAAEFDTVAAARGIMVEPMAKAEVESAWATGDADRLRHHVEAEAIAIWQLWLLESNGQAAATSEAFDGWLEGRAPCRQFRSRRVAHAGDPPFNERNAVDEIAPTPAGDATPWRVDYRMRNPVPTTRYVQPCTAIEPEPTDGSVVFTSITDRYEALTRPLPLAGASVMKMDRHGEIAITRHLRDEAPWLAAAIDRIDAQLRLQLWAGRPWIAFRPLLLTGPPGCGKSHLARLIGQGASTGHAVLDLAGISDARTIEGTARGWTNTQPCFPAIAMKQAMTANPVLTLEEIDKAGGSARNGNPLSVILTMIERSTARSYYDKCLMAPVDLSYVNWIMTANDASRLPAPLRSRLDIVEVTGPGPEHFDALVATILRDLAKDWEVSVTALPTIERSIEEVVRQRFHGHRSVRRLARDIETVVATLIRFEPRSHH